MASGTIDVGGERKNLSLEQRVRDQLSEEASGREAKLVRIVSRVAGITTLLAIALGQSVGFGAAGPSVAFLMVVTLYYSALGIALRHGHYRPWVSWLNVGIEVSVPGALLLFEAGRSGPEAALASPMLLVWAGLIITTALRANPTLAIAAGTLAATEFLGIYAVEIAPRLPDDAPLAYGWVYAVGRGFFLLYAGLATSAVAGDLVGKTETAFKALREQDVMGKYLLVDRLGVGGMAEVFRAVYCPEGGFEKPVALKRVLPAYSENGEFLKLFLEEARLGALLNHPNIVQTLDVGTHQGSWFLALEFVDGLSLDAIASVGPMPPAAVAYVGIELARALEYAHSRANTEGEPLHLVHRDLNPPNVLVSRIGEVKLSDFGIARAASRVRLTEVGMVRGKVQYLSPEQLRLQNFDHRADLFALGLTLWELLVGHPLADSESDEMVFRQLMELPWPALRRLKPGISPEFEAIVMGLLERDLNARTFDGRKLRRQFEALQGDEAPYPLGQKLLVAQLRVALARKQADRGDAAATVTRVAAMEAEPMTRRASPTDVTGR